MNWEITYYDEAEVYIVEDNKIIAQMYGDIETCERNAELIVTAVNAGKGESGL